MGKSDGSSIMESGSEDDSASASGRGSATRTPTRRPRLFTRHSLRSASRPLQSTAYLEPEEPAITGPDGKYLRPSGKAPVDGYSWNNVRGVWVPGQRLLQEMELSHQEPRRRNVGGKRKANDESKTTPSSSGRKRKPSSQQREKMATNEEHKTESPPEYEQQQDSKKRPLEEDDESEETADDEQTADADQEEQDEHVVVEHFHPDSAWKEPAPNGAFELKLTLYEKHRQPRPAPNGTFQCSVRALQQEFRCGICLDYIHETRIVRECLHRFCESCIEKALIQLGGQRRKECPICRVAIPSRRSLEPDPNFDRLLKAVMKGSIVDSGDTSTMDNDEQVSSPMLQQAIHRKRQSIEDQQRNDHQHHDDDDDTDTMDEPSYATNTDSLQASLEVVDTMEETTYTDGHPAPSLVRLVLLRDPERDSAADELRNPFLTISGDATVAILKSFLRQKHATNNVSVWTVVDGGPEEFFDGTRLDDMVNYLTDDFEGDFMPVYYHTD